MKINLAKSSGFCFGVKRALRIALEIAATNNKVYMLGDIVHNADVVRQIKKTGIKRIKKLGKGKGKMLLIRAHGAAQKTFNKACKLGYCIVDATCPMVKEIHKIAREMEKKGYRIIVIGDKEHDEVQGIVGQLNKKAIVIDGSMPFPIKQLKRIKKATLVVQSTQNIDRVLIIVTILRYYIKDLEFINTICRPTRTKQKEIKKLPLENEVMIIIGSRTSANTKRLYQISKILNRRTFWVQSKQALQRKWFRGVKTVGVAAGASTPDSTTQAVIDQIRHYSGTGHHHR